MHCLKRQQSIIWDHVRNEELEPEIREDGKRNEIILEIVKKGRQKPKHKLAYSARSDIGLKTNRATAKRADRSLNIN